MEAIKLFSKLAIENGDGHTDRALIAALNLEVGTFGYTLSSALFEKLQTFHSRAFDGFRRDLLGTLGELSGSTANHQRLFAGFPYATPNQHDYLVKRVIGYLQNAYKFPSNNITVLSCGHAIDNGLFDLTEFSACPICQFAVPELTATSGERYPYANATPLKIIDAFKDGEALREAEKLLGRQSSLSADEKAFLRAYGKPEMAVPGTIFKENLPFVYDLLGVEAVRPHLSGATDVMRLAYFVSSPDADLSLKENVRFKLSTRHRKAFLNLLEGLANLSEDMLRNRERWLRLGERLNPGTAENRKRFPLVAKAFDKLRNDPKSVWTFSRKVERGIRNKDIDASFLRLLGSRPSEFVRKLDFMLRTSRDPDAVIETFAAVAPNVPERLLFTLDKYLASRQLLPKRVFLPKGNENRIQIIDDNRAPIADQDIAATRAVIRGEMHRRFSALEPLGKVWIDPAFADRLLPINQRGASSSITPVTKGNRYPFSGDIVRLFVHWSNGDAERVDVDLSIVLYNNQMTQIDHIAWTNLSGYGCQHSGDIQDAPNGASEFIDFDVVEMLKKGVRYIAAAVNVYTGQRFRQFPCFAGYMERDAIGSGAVYQPETVKWKFDCKTSTTAHNPIIFDLRGRMVIFADMSSAARRFGRVASEHDKQKALTEAVLSLPQRKPTLHDVLLAHANARGLLVSREEAETVYDIADADEIMAQFVS